LILCKIDLKIFISSGLKNLKICSHQVGVFEMVFSSFALIFRYPVFNL